MSECESETEEMEVGEGGEDTGPQEEEEEEEAVLPAETLDRYTLLRLATVSCSLTHDLLLMPNFHAYSKAPT